MRLIALIFIKLHLGWRRLLDYFLSWCYKQQMIGCGKNVNLHPSSSVILGAENMKFGNNVSIPKYATLMSTDAKLIVGNNVLMGRKVTVVTGNHRIDVVGKTIWDSHDKLPENDKDIVYEDDIWTGANVTVLAGAHISRGCVIAAGAVVNKYIPPYSIVGGVPAKVLKYRFTPEQIIEHERALYPESERLTMEQIMESREKYPAAKG